MGLIHEIFTSHRESVVKWHPLPCLTKGFIERIIGTLDRIPVHNGKGADRTKQTEQNERADIRKDGRGRPCQSGYK